MCIRDCDCHQLPDFPVICSKPRLTKRRNCYLLPEPVVLDADLGRGQDRESSPVCVRWGGGGSEEWVQFAIKA